MLRFPREAVAVKSSNRRLLTGRRAVLAGLPGLALAGRAAAQEKDEREIIEAAQQEGVLALATSASAPKFPLFLDSFKRRYPFLDLTTNYLLAPTGKVMEQVEAALKARKPAFDVLHVASLAPYLLLERRGALKAYRSREAWAYPPEALGNTWAVARLTGVIMAYNRNVLKPEAAPKAWADLLRPEFAGGKLVIQDSAAGTCFNQMYHLEKKLGAGFMQAFGAQKPVIVPTMAQVLDLLGRGVALVGATVDHFRAFDDDVVTSGIVAVYPAEGMPVAAAPVAIFEGAPHPNAARLFVDFALSEHGQSYLTVDVMGAYSLHRIIGTAPGQKPLRDANPMFPADLKDYEAAAASFPATFNRYFRS
jgi:iron(III) transport system substrate-binding protein